MPPVIWRRSRLSCDSAPVASRCPGEEESALGPLIWREPAKSVCVCMARQREASRNFPHDGRAGGPDSAKARCSHDVRCVERSG